MPPSQYLWISIPHSPSPISISVVFLSFSAVSFCSAKSPCTVSLRMRGGAILKQSVNVFISLNNLIVLILFPSICIFVLQRKFTVFLGSEGISNVCPSIIPSTHLRASCTRAHARRRITFVSWSKMPRASRSSVFMDEAIPQVFVIRNDILEQAIWRGYKKRKNEKNMGCLVFAESLDQRDRPLLSTTKDLQTPWVSANPVAWQPHHRTRPGSAPGFGQ